MNAQEVEALKALLKTMQDSIEGVMITPVSKLREDAIALWIEIKRIRVRLEKGYYVDLDKGAP